MGSISRMRRADRFIQEFSCDLTGGWKPGSVFVLKRAYLAQDDLFESVRTYLEFENPDGGTTTLCEDHVWFDPENDHYLDDMVERLEGVVDGDVRARLQKVDLP